MMMKYAQIAALAGLFIGGSVMTCQAADTSGRSVTIRYAQMNSPGDGLDREAASQGNGRPSRRPAQRKKSNKRMR